MVFFQCDQCSKAIEISDNVLARARLAEANKLLLLAYRVMSTSAGMADMLRGRYQLQKYIHNNNLVIEETYERQRDTATSLIPIY